MHISIREPAAAEQSSAAWHLEDQVFAEIEDFGVAERFGRDDAGITPKVLQVAMKRRGMADVDIYALFEKLDVDEDGKISKEELRSVLLVNMIKDDPYWSTAPQDEFQKMVDSTVDGVCCITAFIGSQWHATGVFYSDTDEDGLINFDVSAFLNVIT